MFIVLRLFLVCVASDLKFIRFQARKLRRKSCGSPRRSNTKKQGENPFVTEENKLGKRHKLNSVHPVMMLDHNDRSIFSAIAIRLLAAKRTKHQRVDRDTKRQNTRRRRLGVHRIVISVLCLFQPLHNSFSSCNQDTTFSPFWATSLRFPKQE